MCELLWSDPQAENGRSPSKRGVGVAFGGSACRLRTHAAWVPSACRGAMTCPCVQALT